MDFIKEIVHPEGMSRKQEKERKKEIVSRFLQIINALLNEGGGIVCVHTSTPHLLGLFDEAVDELMLSLIPDDTFFDDNFERHYRDTKHVIFRVRPRRRPFSTYDFNTKVSTDKGLVDPTHRQMRYFLKELSQTHPDQQGNEILGQNISLRFTEDSEVEVSIGNTDIVFQEDAGTQAKTLSLKSKGNQEQWTYRDILHCFEKKERLQKYITAFSKRQTGGSIYWGVYEHKQDKKQWTEMENISQQQAQLLQSFGQPDLKLYKDNKLENVYHLANESEVPTAKGVQKTGEFRCQGIHIGGLNERDFSNHLIREIKNKMLWVDHAAVLDPSRLTSDNLEAAVGDHIEVQFHPVRTSQGLDSDKTVIEVHVRRYRGMSFIDKSGPKAYQFKYQNEDSSRSIVKADIKLWLRKNTQLFPVDA